MALTADRSSLFVGFGAGLASAALVASIIGGTPLAVPLSMLAGLPVAIAAIGWGRVAGLVAAAVGSGVIALAFNPLAGLNLFATTQAPILIAAHFLLLSRPVPAGTGGPARIEWYPLGRILGLVALSSAIGVIVVGAAVGYDTERAMRAMSRAVALVVRAQDRPVDPALTAALDQLVRATAHFVPAFVALFHVVVTAINLWLGAHAVRKSERLARPWEDLAEIDPPKGFALAFAATLVIGASDTTIGVLALPFAGALFAVYFLVGLGVIHAATRGAPFRVVLIGAVYTVTFILSFPAVLVALVGLAEPFLGLRRRKWPDADHHG